MPHMRLDTALEKAFGALIPSAPPTIESQVQAIGGSRAAAQALIDAGATKSQNVRSVQRSVERWVKSERGEPGQTRHPSEAAQNVLARQGAAATQSSAIERIRTDGLQARFEGEITNHSGDQEERELDSEMAGEDLDAFADAVAAGDWEAAAATFNEAFFEGYGLDGTFAMTDVQGLEVGWG